MNYIMTDSTITVLINGIPQIVDNSHPKFNEIKEGIKFGISEDELLYLIDTTIALKTYSKGKIEVVNGEVRYKDKVVKNTLTDRILTMLEENFNIDGMCMFMDNLYSNPSKTAVDELYLFLESCNLPITEDGHFLAYKKIRHDYKDIYSGKFDNSIGSKPEMERNEVCDDRGKTCSEGLHFASYSYMKHYGGSGNGDRIVIVKINPADVVSIPEDYNNAKGRCWTYEVVNEIANDGVSQIKNDCIKDSEAYSVYFRNESKLKDLKNYIAKSLYSGEMDIVELDLILADNNIIGIDYEDNFNQISQSIRKAARNLDADLLDNLVNDIVNFKRLQVEDNNVMKSRKLKSGGDELDKLYKDFINPYSSLEVSLKNMLDELIDSYGYELGEIKKTDIDKNEVIKSVVSCLKKYDLNLWNYLLREVDGVTPVMYHYNDYNAVKRILETTKQPVDFEYLNGYCS